MAKGRFGGISLSRIKIKITNCSRKKKQPEFIKLSKNNTDGEQIK